MRIVARTLMGLAIPFALISACGGGSSAPNATPPPVVTVPDIRISGSAVNEGAGSANFSITLSEVTTVAVSVEYATSDGTATAGTDYTPASGRVDFAAGQTTQTVTVEVVDDSVNEPEEDFFVQLSNGSGVTIVQPSASASIEDDDIEAPTGLQLTDRFGELEVTWQPVANADGYTVYRAREPGVRSDNWQQLDGGRSYDVTGSSISVTGAPQMDYYFTVVSQKGSYVSSDSSEITGRISEGPETRRVNVSSGLGHESNGYTGNRPAISHDGRFIAYCSAADNIVANDTNGLSDIFLYDMETRLAVRISNGFDGSQPDGPCTEQIDISSDGQVIAYSSLADNLVANDGNGRHDVFVHDRRDGSTSRVSVRSDGSDGEDTDNCAPPGCWFTRIELSPDGRYVAMSAKINLDPAPVGSGGIDVFVHDRETGSTNRVLTRPEPTTLDDGAASPSLGISSGGGLVLFSTGADDVVVSDTNVAEDVFVHNRSSGQTTLVSTASDGTQANSGSSFGQLSSNGQFAAFMSLATNLALGKTDGLWGVYWKDLSTNETRLVSVSSDGQYPDDAINAVKISADGRAVATQSMATNLVPDDTNGVGDVYVHWLESRETWRVSLNYEGDESQADIALLQPTDLVDISGDGRFVLMHSEATDLVPDDTNGLDDIFVRGPLYPIETVDFVWGENGGSSNFVSETITFDPVQVTSFLGLQTNGEWENSINSTFSSLTAQIYLFIDNQWVLFAEDDSIRGATGSRFPLDSFTFSEVDFAAGPLGGIRFTLTNTAGTGTFRQMVPGTTFTFRIN